MDLRADAEPMGVRRLWVLVSGLPPGAAVWRRETEWTWERELLASQIEVLDGWMRIFAKALGQRMQGKPIEIPRPDDAAEARKPKVTTDPVAIRRFFQRTG